MRKIVAALATFVLVLSLFSLPANQAAAAEDDITGIALEEEMRHLISLGIIKGYGDNIYKPQQSITRGEFANYVSRALTLPSGEHKFPDVAPSSALAPGINAVAAAGIVSGGTDGYFRPDHNITREQIALIISNAMDYLGMEAKEAALPFKDINKIQNETFKLAISRNVAYGIISGFNDDTFRPKRYATRAEAAAFISRLLKAHDEAGEPSPTPTDSYKVGTIQSNGTITYSSKTYSTYDAAAAAITSASNQVVAQGEKIVKMPQNGGLAITKTASDVTVVYSQPSFATNAYVLFGVENTPNNREMQYLDSGENYVKVKIADTEGYVKLEAVELVPYQMVTNRSYFTVQSGDLIHLEYNFKKKAYEAGYAVGPAPDFLREGVKYYSWNGHDYYSENGTKAGTAYNYFQYLPIRTTTSYTAAELDKIIDLKLKERGVTNGLLTGKGAFLKQVEEQYRINALFILAFAGHESRYGTSAYAIERNNLFGIRAFDSNPDNATYFDSVEDSIITLARDYMNARYVSPNVAYDHGAVAGNKTTGVNVRYASDPYWGLKIARHMYGLDKVLGGKDLGKYEIGITNTSGLNIRTQASTASSVVFQYDKAGYPVAILDTVTTSSEGIWYKIISDKLETAEANVYSVYVDKLNTVTD